MSLLTSEYLRPLKQQNRNAGLTTWDWCWKKGRKKPHNVCYAVTGSYIFSQLRQIIAKRRSKVNRQPCKNFSKIRKDSREACRREKSHSRQAEWENSGHAEKTDGDSKTLSVFSLCLLFCFGGKNCRQRTAVPGEKSGSGLLACARYRITDIMR